MAINKIIMTGRFTADPELKQTPSGKVVTNFSLAQSKSKDETVYFNFTAWSGTAEFICKYFRKGDGIEVEGHLSVRAYEKDGAKRVAYEIVCEHVDFPMGKRSEGGQAMTDGGQAVGAVPQYANASSADFEEITDDSDLPF